MSVFTSGLSRLRNSFRRKSSRLSDSHSKSGALTGDSHSKSGALTGNSHSKSGALTGDSHSKSGALTGDSHSKSGALTGDSHSKSGALTGDSHSKSGALTGDSHSKSGALTGDSHSKSGALTGESCKAGRGKRSCSKSSVGNSSPVPIHTRDSGNRPVAWPPGSGDADCSGRGHGAGSWPQTSRPQAPSSQQAPSSSSNHSVRSSSSNSPQAAVSVEGVRRRLPEAACDVDYDDVALQDDNDVGATADGCDDVSKLGGPGGRQVSSGDPAPSPTPQSSPSLHPHPPSSSRPDTDRGFTAEPPTSIHNTMHNTIHNNDSKCDATGVDEDGHSPADSSTADSFAVSEDQVETASMTAGVSSGGEADSDGQSSGHSAVADSDDGGDPQPLTDTGHHHTDHSPALQDAPDPATDPDALQDAASLAPTLRTTTGTPRPNRVSFGSHLQEVLGRAEQGECSGSDAMTASACESDAMTASACEIPPTLKESPSLLALHNDPTENITCRVCNQLLAQPRILPCLHTFCAACIADLQTYPINPLDERATAATKESRDALSPSPVQDSTSSSSFSQSSRRSCEVHGGTEGPGEGPGEGPRVVLCPTCLRETRVSCTLLELPPNHVAERRVAHYQATHRGGLQQDCDSCGDHGNACVVSARCVECGENLCTLCELSHRRQKKTKRHQLLDITAPTHASKPGQASSPGAANQRRGRSQVTSPAPPRRPIMCGRHAEEEVKLYCVTCDLPVCRDCVVLEHRDHDCRFLSKELFQEQMSQVQQKIRAVVPHITSVDQQLKKLADCQEQIRSRGQQVRHDVTAHMDRFLAAMQRHRQRLLQQVGRVVEEKQHSLHVTERHLRQVRQDVEHTCRFVSDLIENGSDVEILSVKRVVTERLSTLQEVSATQRQPVSSFIRFSPSDPGEIINNFQMFGRVLSRRASAATSVLYTDGLSTARVGQRSCGVLEVRGEEGGPYTGTDVDIKAWLVHHSTQGIRSLPVSVEGQGQGQGRYSLQFTPDQPGPHLLHVAVHSQPVKDSPVRLKVKGQWRGHGGVWQCCTVCSTGGRTDIPCACRGLMPGGQKRGCRHGEPGHPGGQHWSCCGKMVHTSHCSGLTLPPTSPRRQVTL